MRARDVIIEVFQRPFVLQHSLIAVLIRPSAESTALAGGRHQPTAARRCAEADAVEMPELHVMGAGYL